MSIAARHPSNAFTARPRPWCRRSWLQTLALGLALWIPFGCASEEAATKDDPSPTSDRRLSANEEVPPEKRATEQTDETDAVLAAPATWSEVATRYEFVCPAPWFELQEPAEIALGKRTLRIEGSTAVFDPPLGDKIVFGVLGALKDASAATRKNVRKAMKSFRKAGVNIVVVNGDLAEDEGISAVFEMLWEEVDLPTVVHAGNIEWAGAFSPAYDAASKKFPQLLNGNWIRVFDLGSYALVTLPGYWNLKFIRSGACRYDPSEVDALLPVVKRLEDSGKTVVLTAHGPPRGQGRDALDLTYDQENVGDPKLAALIRDGNIRFGLFSHILEAGGRAVKRVDDTKKIKRPQKKPTSSLYINAGSASGYPWEMLSKKTSKGMAAIVTLSGGKGKVKFVKLVK